MRSAEVGALLRRFTYKPNVAVMAVDAPTGPQVAIQMMVPDSTKGFQPVRMRRDYPDEIFAWGSSVRRAYLPSVSYVESYEVIEVSGIFPVPDHIRREDEFWGWLRHTLYDIEHHECDEWFQVDGKAIYDPHAPEERVP